MLSAASAWPAPPRGAELAPEPQPDPVGMSVALMGESAAPACGRTPTPRDVPPEPCYERLWDGQACAPSPVQPVTRRLMSRQVLPAPERYTRSATWME